MHLSRLFLALAVVALAGATARATTVVVPSDDQLFDASRAVVEGRVTEIRSRRTGGEIFTYVSVDVSTVLSGDVATGRVVLKQIGGRVGDDFTSLFGSPEFAVGERVLLYLDTDDDGAWHTAFLFLGKYSVVERDGRAYVARGAANEGVLVLDGDSGAATEVAPYDEYVAAIARRAAATKRVAPLVLATAVPAELSIAVASKDEASHTSFTILRDKARWFEPDAGQTVPYRIQLTPFLPDGGQGAVADALAAWSSVPGSSARLVLEDETERCGLSRDGENIVSFEDCRGQIGSGGCFGIIAVTSISGKSNEHRTINGVDFVRITDADVVLNNGQQTCLLGHRLTIREVITHEIGHSIGLGHSSESGPEPNTRLAEATMYYQLHDDGRGASLKPDDIDGVTFVYPATEVAPAISTETLLPASVGTPYVTRLEVTGGEAPFAWAVTAGELPARIALSGDGALSGTPAARGVATFTITVTDARGRVASRDLALDVVGPRPSVASVVYKANKKMTITATVEAGASIEVWVNGTRVAPPARVKRKANGDGATRITIKGSASALNVTEPAGANALVLVADGSESEPFSF